MDITITPAAQKFMRRMVRFGGDGATGFRLLVSPGGCSGLARQPRNFSPGSDSLAWIPDASCIAS